MRLIFLLLLYIPVCSLIVAFCIEAVALCSRCWQNGKAWLSMLIRDLGFLNFFQKSWSSGYNFFYSLNIVVTLVREVPFQLKCVKQY